MSFLLALVAFAAVLAVYSTIVTVVVEGIHKFFGLRSSGMTETLRAFHDRTLASLQPGDTPAEAQAPVGVASERASPQARDFANKICRRSASESLRPWYIRRWPFIGSLLSSRQQHMSTLQFIESLAETPQGAALARHARPQLRSALAAAAYEFERLNEAQGQYFKSRAMLLSVIAGMAVAIFVNLDAITLYKELSTNSALSSRLTQLANSSSLAEIQQTAFDAGLDVEDPAVTAAKLANFSTDLKTMGIPVGRSMFPHCENYQPDEARKLSEQDSGYRDPRCGFDKQEKVNSFWALSYSEFLDKEKNVRSANRIEHVGHWMDYRAQRIAVVRHNPQTFIMWLLGVGIAGGLLGLGAPFWFNLFAKAASIAAPATRATLSAYTERPDTTQTPPPPGEDRIRKSDTTDPAELERGFLIMLGRGSEVISDGAATHPPPGREIGRRPPPRST